MKYYTILINYSLLLLGLSFSSCEQLKEIQENETKAHLPSNNHERPINLKNATHKINELILQRWSPRAMSGEQVTHDQLMALFEAARWAPSSYNNQPWRFIYVTKNDPSWNKMFNLLVPFNQSWAQNAAALILVISHNYYEHNNKPSQTHSFDTGAAVQNISLQGYSMGLVTHAMEGFDYTKARTEFNIPEDYTIEAMLAIGLPSSKETLPKDLQEKEYPSNRKEITQFISQGTFGEWPTIKKD